MSAREWPILFSGPMVRAILEGRKTQTRRIAHLMLDGETTGDGLTTCGWEPDARRGWGRVKPGDRLWVRETWTHAKDWYPASSYAYRADEDISDDDTKYHVCRQDVRERGIKTFDCIACDWRGWRPSIFMPRAASRITLEATATRVELLQDITDADALAEGVCAARIQDARNPSMGPLVDAYANLWDAINGKRASWESNPWVWVISFERVKP